MKKILVVTVNWLGDALLTTPVFKALKEKFPCSRVLVMAEERVKKVFENNPYIDEIIPFHEKTLKKNFSQKLKLVDLLKKKKIDTVFLIHQSFTRAAICWLAGIKERIGYQRVKTCFILTRKIPIADKPIHRQDHYLRLFQADGVIIKDPCIQFFIPKSEFEKADLFLKNIRREYKYLAGIHPSANWPLKRWPAENFASLADNLIQNYNCAVFFTGAEKDKEIVEKVTKNMRQKYFDLCGKTNLTELGALMKNMTFFISNDSGPAHLAAGLGVHTIVLFGPTSSEITAPKGKYVKIIHKNSGCKIPCYKLDCLNNQCMKNIQVQDVLSEIKKR